MKNMKTMMLGVGCGVLLAVSPDGEEAVAAAVVFSWETDSIYNDMEAPVTYTARAVTATVDAI